MFMLPDIEQWSSVGNYGYIRHDVYLSPKNMTDLDLVHVRLDRDYNVVQATAHVPLFNLWVEFSAHCPSKMPER